ncbi:phenolic glucoside malonyltransferase 1 [Rosa chinensis]|nr:phenolic glucoside malonyltransferase 1 [Rosa chinensis]
MPHPNTSVQIVEVCRVTPQPNSPDSTADTPDLSLPLTYFDLFWLRFPPVQRLYFYELTSSPSNFVLENLKSSLSLVLQHFLPLAGNLTWPQDSHTPILRYFQGDAVSLTVAESDADSFDHLSGYGEFIEAKDYHPLVPRLDVSHEQAAAIALQVTLFPSRGFVIGTTMHHAILDGKTSTSFVKSWAHACQHMIVNNGVSADSDFLLPDQLKPLYDRKVIHDPTGHGLGSLCASEWQNMDGPDNKSVMWDMKTPLPDSVRRIFEFTRAKIHVLRQIVLDAKVSDSLLHLSTFTLVCAYMWVCLVKAQEVDGDKMTVQAFSVDCRARLDPPIPANYFGNCIAGAAGFVKAKELLGEDGLVVAVKAISEAIQGLDKGVLNGAEVWVSRIKDFVQVEGVYSIAGSHRFQIYETNFGWGRPKKVEVVSIDRTGAISLSDSKNGGGGVEVGVVLRKHAMEAFGSLFAKGFGDH